MKTRIKKKRQANIKAATRQSGDAHLAPVKIPTPKFRWITDDKILLMEEEKCLKNANTDDEGRKN